jgi:hypothetical protein
MNRKYMKEMVLFIPFAFPLFFQMKISVKKISPWQPVTLSYPVDTWAIDGHFRFRGGPRAFIWTLLSEQC